MWLGPGSRLKFLHKHVTFAVPGSLDTLTGGFLYDRHIITGLRQCGWSVNVLDVGQGFPCPDKNTRQQACEAFRRDTSTAPLVVDGLALGALPEAARQVSATRPLIGLVHHPLFLESGHSAETRERLYESEKIALSHTKHVITTSRETRDRVASDFQVPSNRVTNVEPGIKRPDTPPSYRDAAHVNILSVGTLIPRKGHDRLIEALATLRDLAWTLRIIGSAELDPNHARTLRALVATHDLGDRVIFADKVSDTELEDHYATSDVFALASDYEGYGIAFAEAILRGLPVIGTTGGAIKDTVPEGTGILVPPGDADALRAALKDLLAFPQRRRIFAAAARRSGSHFQTWDVAVRRFASVLEDF